MGSDVGMLWRSATIKPCELWLIELLRKLNGSFFWVHSIRGLSNHLQMKEMSLCPALLSLLWLTVSISSNVDVPHRLTLYFWNFV